MYRTYEARAELAGRIYDLDAEVYEILGSGLGRVFNGKREAVVRDLATLIGTHNKMHFLRSEIALIGNMARTIPDKQARARIMERYEAIVQEIDGLVGSFGEEDILDEDTYHIFYIFQKLVCKLHCFFVFSKVRMELLL